MKIKYSICLILVFSFLCFGQQNEKAKILNKYLDSLKNYQVDGYSKFMTMGENEFKHIIIDAYKAIEIASPEMKKIFDINYYTAYSCFLRAVKSRYSYFLTTLIRVPIFVKAKILSKNEVKKGSFFQINLKLKPEYRLKGKEQFLSQPEFEVYYREYENVPKDKDYKVGESYLFPLWDRAEPDNKIFAIATWMDGHGSRFLIKDNLIYDEYNFFNLGLEINWDYFIQKFNEMITQVLTGGDLDIFKKYNNY